jgi:cold-inducible RNA-binding protein
LLPLGFCRRKAPTQPHNVLDIGVISIGFGDFYEAWIRHRSVGRAADTTQTYMAARLFIGNLPFTTTENDLQDHFGQAGGVVAVNIMQDRATGRSRGFAFIEMASQDDASKAITMFHQKDFQGRPLTVNEARPREERPAGGRDGGGGYRDRR